MKKTAWISLFFILFINFSYSQEEVLKFSLEDKKGFLIPKKGYSFSSSNGNIALIISDKNNFFAKLLDSSFNEISSITAKPVKKKYNLRGFILNGKQYSILYSSSSKKKYGVLNLDFENKSAIFSEIEIDLGKEFLVETLQYKERLLIISTNSNNQLILREFKNNTFELIKKFELSNNEVIKENNYFIKQYVSTLTKLDNRVPNSIEAVAEPKKMYLNDGVIYVTFDNNKKIKQTTLYVIDIENINFTVKTFNYPEGKKGDFKKYNSFILENKLYQIASSSEEMKIVVNTFEGEELKSFYLDKDQPITIKNSPIIQEGGQYVGYREMEKTAKYLRKISGGDIGISVYKNGANYEITVGGFKKIHNQGISTFPVSGMANSAGVVVYIYNPTYYSYNSYSWTKSTFFHTTLDSGFKYIKKEREDNVFNKIDAYFKEIKRETAKDVFFHQGILYFSYFDMRTKEFSLLKL